MKNNDISDKMPEAKELYDLTEFFKVLGDPTRVRLLYLLFEQGSCVSELAGRLNASESAISHQLRVLKASGLVTKHRVGKMAIYNLSDHHVRTIVVKGREHITDKQ